jgi:hypothetical protein
MHQRARMATVLAAALAVVGLSVPASGQVVTVLTLDGTPMVDCNEIWQENDVDLHFTETTDEDCTLGACSFGIDASFVWLFPSRLVVDFGESYAISAVEIDWVDFCGTGCTRAFLYDGGTPVASVSNSGVGGLETVTMVPSGGMADSIAISSCEGQVHEIRIDASTVAAEPLAWGQVKALYR